MYGDVVEATRKDFFVVVSSFIYRLYFCVNIGEGILGPAGNLILCPFKGRDMLVRNVLWEV